MQFVPLEYELGLITHAQQIKPQGWRFRQLADEWRKQTPVMPTTLDAPPAGEHTNENTWNWLQGQTI